MGFLGAAHGPPENLSHISYSDETWQLYLTQRRSKKYASHLTHPSSSADISIFSPEISKFCYIKKYRYRLGFDTSFLYILTFLESSQIAIIIMVKVLMISAKMATPAFVKKGIFQIKVITSYIMSMTSPAKFCHMTEIILWMWSCDQSLVTLAFV